LSRKCKKNLQKKVDKNVTIYSFGTLKSGPNVNILPNLVTLSWLVFVLKCFLEVYHEFVDSTFPPIFGDVSTATVGLQVWTTSNVQKIGAPRL
jgi:hypothetical protein